MNTSARILISCLFICLISLPGFSQERDSTIQKDKRQEKSSETDGLRKIASGSQFRDIDIEINIDNEALEQSIESAIRVSMDAVETSFENLDIHIEPIGIDLVNLNIDIDPVNIDIPDLNINIEPIDIGDMDFNVNIDKDIDR